jgi:restriction endonuclease S subunit
MSSKFVFGDCAELRSEKIDPKSSQESFYIGLEHIEQQSLSLMGHGLGSDVNSQKQKFYKGDILFGKLRPYFRKVILAPFDGICSTDIWVIKPKAGIDRYFLFYWMASEDFIASSTYASEGGRMPRAKWDWVTKFELEMRNLDEQIAIGKVLRVLDEKIEANKVASKTLENIAQTIFKSWFIDFDPVNAKMAGQKPAGMDVATAALFPDSMEESELGLIPKGWVVIPSTEMFEILSGGTPKTTNAAYWSGDIPWFSVADAPENGGCFFIKTAKCITPDGLGNSAAKLVRPGVTIISARGTVGKTAIVAVPSTFNQSCYGIQGHYGDFFTYLMLRNQIARLQNISHGGMFDTITRETFSAIKTTKPSEKIISVFETLVTPLFLEIRNLQFQGEGLIALRDSLLPRLISGELQIPEEMLAS